MSLSLKQQLSNVSSALQSQVDTLSTETSEAVTFFHNIVRESANITALESTVSTNASGISGLQTTTSQQTTDIGLIQTNVSNNAQSIIDLNDGFITALATKQPNLVETSEVVVKSITLHDHSSNDGQLLDYAVINNIENNIIDNNTAINTERERALAAEDGLQSNINTENTRAEDAEAALQTNLDTETASRVAADNKMCFSFVMEFDGLLEDNSYPFSCGFGVPSSNDLGIPIPFGYKFIGIGAQSKNTGPIKPAVNLSVEGYIHSTSTPNPIWTFDTFLGTSRSVSALAPSSLTGGPGYVSVKVVDSTGAPDPDARYRVTLFFQSTNSF